MLVGTITALGKTVLLVTAVSFIVWSLVTAISIPKRNPTFPRNLRAFLVASAILFVVQMSAVVWVTSTQEVEAAEAAEAGSGEEPTETTPAETTPTETAPTETGGEAPAAKGDPAAGKQVFASAGCGACHTLADAGASGNVGPVLDDVKPPYELVVARVTNGKGVMPPFKGQLDEKQIQDVAAYVSSVAGS